MKELTAIAEEHLAKYPGEERDARVAAFSRAKVTSARRVAIPNLHGVLISGSPRLLPEVVNDRINESLAVSVLQKVLKFPFLTRACGVIR